VYLGLLAKGKGVHTAIAVARATNCSLKIAGTANTPEGRAYFQSDIQPYLDRHLVEYIGEVDDRQKNELLGGAKALLFPVEWEEAFGFVMVESLACGTPVIGLNRCAVPEVVTHGVNGFICNSLEDMIEAVRHISEIDRAVCRETVETRFSHRVVAAQYEKLYYKMLQEGC
jgi:glycosyltransferase involved in cell wall biosynthesis